MNDIEKLASGEYVKCACANVIPIACVNCPYCKAINYAGDNKTCAACGTKLLTKEAREETQEEHQTQIAFYVSTIAVKDEEIAALKIALADAQTPPA